MWVQQRSKYQGQTSKSKIEEAGDPRNRLPLAQLVLTMWWGQVRARSICPPSNFLQEILHRFRENRRERDSICLESVRRLRLADKTAIMTVYLLAEMGLSVLAC